MMIADATITNAVYSVNGLADTISLITRAAHSSPKITNLSMTDVFITAKVTFLIQNVKYRLFKLYC